MFDTTSNGIWFCRLVLFEISLVQLKFASTNLIKIFETRFQIKLSLQIYRVSHFDGCGPISLHCDIFVKNVLDKNRSRSSKLASIFSRKCHSGKIWGHPVFFLTRSIFDIWYFATNLSLKNYTTTNITSICITSTIY